METITVEDLMSEKDITSYAKSIVNPGLFTNKIPDESLTPATLKSDKATQTITVPQPFVVTQQPEIWIEFYPLTANQVFGAIYLPNTAAAGMVWNKNITRTSDLKDNFDWIRAVGKKLMIKVNSRPGGNFDISGKISAIQSLANVEQFVDRISSTLLPGVVDDPLMKVESDVMEGIVMLAIPQEFDLPFRRLNDDCAVLIAPAPGTVNISSLYSNNIDYNRSIALRSGQTNTMVLPAGVATTILLDNTYYTSGLTPPSFNFTGLFKAPGGGTAGTLSVKMATKDLVGTVIATSQFDQNIVNLVSNQYFSFQGCMPYHSSMTNALRRPYHYFEIQVSYTSVGGSAAVPAGNFNWSFELLNPGGSNTGDSSPVQVAVLDALEVGTKIDFLVETLDEVIPNQALQANTVPEPPEVNWPQKKFVELLTVHAKETGFRPVMEVKDYDKLLDNLEDFDTNPLVVEKIMHASSGNIIKKALGYALKGAKALKYVAPVAGLVDPRLEKYANIISKTADKIPYKASSTGGFVKRELYSASGEYKDPNLKNDDEDNEIKEVVFLTPLNARELKPDMYESAFLFPAVSKRGETAVTQLFVAISNLKVAFPIGLVSKSRGRGKVYNYKTRGFVPLNLKNDIVLLPAEITEDRRVLVNFTEAWPIKGASCSAAISLVDNYKIKCSTNYCLTGVVDYQSRGYISRVYDLEYKAQLAKSAGLVMLHSDKNLYPGAKRVETVGEAFLLAKESQPSLVKEQDGDRGHSKRLEDASKFMFWMAADEEPKKGGFRSRDLYLKSYKEPEPTEDELDAQERDYDKLVENLQNVIQQFLDARGETLSNGEGNPYHMRAAILNEQLYYTDELCKKNNTVEQLKAVVIDDFGKGVRQFAEEGYYNITATRKHSVVVNKQKRNYELYRQVFEESELPPWDKLTDKARNLISTYFSNLAAYGMELAVQPGFKVTPLMINSYNEGSGEYWGTDYQGNIGRVINEMAARGIPAEKFGDVADLMLNLTKSEMLSKEDNRKLSRIENESKGVTKSVKEKRTPKEIIADSGYLTLLGNEDVLKVAEEFLDVEEGKGNFEAFAAKKKVDLRDLQRKRREEIKDQKEKGNEKKPQTRNTAEPKTLRKQLRGQAALKLGEREHS